MTGRRGIVRAVGVAAVALGLTAQAAQAKPMEVLPRHTVTVVAVPARPHVPLASRHASAWSAAKMHALGNPSARGEASVGDVLQPGATASESSSGSGGVNWAAVVGGSAIVALVGALGVALFRLRPQRPSAA